MAAGAAVKLALVLLAFGTAAGAATRANAPGLPEGFSPLSVDYDPALELFIAQGSFSVLRDNKILVSDQLVYNPRSDIVYASGDLRLRTMAGDRPLKNPVVLHGAVKDAFAKMAQDVLDRHDIQAPLAGIVTGLQFQTPGAVIPAGGTVLDIVPEGSDLVVVARIRPEDIDNVRVGLPVRFRLTALSRRTSPTFNGEVSYVSPDQIVDPQTNRAYFEARVKVSDESVAMAEPDQLRPGAPAEVAIITGDRTVLEYVLTPFTRALDRGLREQ